jgi:hypothetical protein
MLTDRLDGFMIVKLCFRERKGFENDDSRHNELCSFMKLICASKAAKRNAMSARAMLTRPSLSENNII